MRVISYYPFPLFFLLKVDRNRMNNVPFSVIVTFSPPQEEDRMRRLTFERAPPLAFLRAGYDLK